MPRQFSPRMFPNSISIAGLVTTQDAAGGRVKSWPTSSDYAASVQLGDPMRLGAWQGQTASEVEGIVEMPIDPLVKVDDKLTWHVVPGDSTQDRVFTILGPATAEAGRTVLYTIPVKRWK